jgi:hypothetical protein
MKEGRRSVLGLKMQRVYGRKRADREEPRTCNERLFVCKVEQATNHVSEA